MPLVVQCYCAVLAYDCCQGWSEVFACSYCSVRDAICCTAPARRMPCGCLTTPLGCFASPGTITSDRSATSGTGKTLLRSTARALRLMLWDLKERSIRNRSQVYGVLTNQREVSDFTRGLVSKTFTYGNPGARRWTLRKVHTNGSK